MSTVHLLIFMVVFFQRSSSSDELKDSETCVVKVDSHGRVKLVNKDIVYYGLLVGALRDLASGHGKTQSRNRKNSNLGTTPSRPGKSCQEIKAVRPSSPSAVYWIQPIENAKPMQVHCDMKTAQGGWTLVWNYGFTSYAKFKSHINAVTPRPNWPTPGATARISTTVPLHESHEGAMDFNMWKHIGQEFLVKSSINHWFACEPYKTKAFSIRYDQEDSFQAGSLVNWQTGNVMCKVVKHADVNKKCWYRKPHFLRIGRNGPKLESKRDAFYYFDGSESSDWPIHDPCGAGSGSYYVKNATMPGGSLFIR